jgi:peptidoglycan-associated lipoprotein
MIRVRLGRGGWVNSIGASVARIGAAAMLCAALALPGCSSKQAPTGAEAGAGAGASGLGEEGAGKTSLQQLQTGTLGSGTGGPLTDIHFDYNEFTIRAQDGEILRTDARWLEQHAVNRVQVEGHCDERGSEEYNIALGAKRAQAAKEYLTTLGVAGDRISTISYGKELPLCTEHEESCWAQNRRAHFVVSK